MPTKLFLGAARVDGVTAVVPRAVGHARDEVAVIARARRDFVEAREQLVEQHAVGQFVSAAHEVGRAGRAALGGREQAAGVVVNVQPIADLHAVAVHGHALAGQGPRQGERHELLRELERPVVVGGVRGYHRQAVSMEVGGREVIGPRLAGAVRRARVVAAVLVEHASWPEGAVDLVRAHVHHAERPPRRGWQVPPVMPHRLEQVEGANGVRLHELPRSVDRTVDVRLRGQVDYGSWLLLAQEFEHGGLVVDVELHEAVTAPRASWAQAL